MNARRERRGSRPAVVRWSIVGQQQRTAGAFLDDPFNLQRFTDAQERVIGSVLAELRAGRKHSHWIWFVFPQLRGLGSSEMSARYAITSLAEARAYLAHPVLGPRLRQCTQLVLAVPRTPISEIFGAPDDLKFRSSMTLFAHAAGDDALFREALRIYFDAVPDAATEALL